MSDLIDTAQKTTDLHLQVALQQAAEKQGPPPCGHCYYCDEPLGGAKRWCDAECRDAWQEDQDARARDGRATHAQNRGTAR